MEVRVQNPPDEGLRRKISERLRTYYPNVREQVARGVQINLDEGTTSFDEVDTVISRTNEDANEVVIFGQTGIIVSQLGLYPGWDYFFSRFERDWAAWKDVVGYRKVVQIGLRYVNRIDVPMVDGVSRHEDYLTLQITLPEEFELNLGYSLNVRLPLQEIKCFANINSGTIPPPVPEHAAFLLDIDIVRAIEPPQKDADISKLLHQMRDAKNDLFEGFVTDAARETFRHDEPLR